MIKMLLSVCLVGLGVYIFSISSFHSLIILLFVELLILGGVVYLFSFSFSWFSFIMVLLVAVCLGAYGVSLLVSNSRSKGGSYFVSF